MPDIFYWIGGGVLPIFMIIIVVVLIVSYIGSRYKVAGANEALIVSGQRASADGHVASPRTSARGGRTTRERA